MGTSADPMGWAASRVAWVRPALRRMLEARTAEVVCVKQPPAEAEVLARAMTPRPSMDKLRDSFRC